MPHRLERFRPAGHPPFKGAASARCAQGFSLVELVVVIVIMGIIASAVGLFIAEPIRGFLDQARRAALVDAAAMAQLRMSRDLRRALPNSVRIAGSAMELLLTADGDRYRAESPGSQDDRLRFNNSDDNFNTYLLLGGGAAPAGSRLAIYPLLQDGANPYTSAVMTPAATTITLNLTPVTVSGNNEFRISLNPAHPFPYDSPSRRVYLVEGPVSYICDTANTRLLRYSGYAVQAAQPATVAALDVLTTGTLVTEKVESCGFQYDPGTFQRNAVVTLALVLAQEEERIRLLRQVHVDNSP